MIGNFGFALLENINIEISKLNHEFSVILVDDSSKAIQNLSKKFYKIQSIKLIKMELKCFGHARCNDLT